MSNTLLLPNKFKLIGWFILIPSFIAGILKSFIDFDGSWLHFKVFAIMDGSLMESNSYFEVIETNIGNTLVGTLFLIGAMLVSFSREKMEDEFIARLRLSSLLWAVCLNYILLFFAFLFVYGLAFFNIMVFNMYTVLVIFIIRFNFILFKNSKLAAREK